MSIESKLIHIVYIHTECSLTAIHFECAFSQSTSIGGLKSFEGELHRDVKQCNCYNFACNHLHKQLNDKARNNMRYFVASLR